MKLSLPLLATVADVSHAKLEARDGRFWLDGEETRLLSGSIHYFRVPHQYWRDRLLKLKATGLNMVETYTAWNLHEPYEGEFNFANDKHSNLDLAEFIRLAGELDLLVNLRPGPYICAEWEWGGHPYWLLQDEEMKVRTTYPGYQRAVRNYYEALFEQVGPLLYENGGPVVMVQVENEYAGYGSEVDPEYLPWLRDLTIEMGVNELLFTCDGFWDLPKYQIPDSGVALDDVLWTVNFKDGASNKLDRLFNMQPDKPVMVMEWWTGWFDYWGIDHQTWSAESFGTELKSILEYGEFGGHVNYYMYHGGTNFGWMNGANWNVGQESGRFEYQPVTTSYDYDSPLSEHGNMTEKCTVSQQLFRDIVGIDIPDVDVESTPPTVTHEAVSATQGAQLWRNLAQAEKVEGSAPMAMEFLPVNKNRGQPYGYVLYEATNELSQGSHTIDKMNESLNGRATIHVNNQLQYRITNTPGNQDIAENIEINAESDGSKVSILYENSGRINYKRLNGATMGLREPVGIDGEMEQTWNIISLPMDEDYLNSLRYDAGDARTVEAPAFYKMELVINADNHKDTFLNMENWTKGVVWVNGVNLGRYWAEEGPATTMYLPAPFLQVGTNEIIVFEEVKSAPSRTLQFLDYPVLQK